MKQNWIALLLGAATLATATTVMAGPGLPIRYADDRTPEKYLSAGPQGGWTLGRSDTWRPVHRVMLVKKTVVTEERFLLRPGERTLALRHHPRHHHARMIAPVGERNGDRPAGRCCKSHKHHKAHLRPVGQRITRVEITRTILEPVGERTVMLPSKRGGTWGLKPVLEKVSTTRYQSESPRETWIQSPADSPENIHTPNSAGQYYR